MDLITVDRAIRTELREKKYALISADEFAIVPELATDRQYLWADWGNLEDEQGEPTPEGLHHDGDDFNVIHLIRRQNATGGKSTVCDNDRNLLASCTLRQPMDSVLVWDPHVMHGVTPIHPENQSEPAIRDVLVIGYNYRPDLRRPV